ncbi:MAG: two-component system response regulator KdpE [Proteobacteria bacterium]|nr:two-component system response regulator KdpE [Pseudomonadota bacterium]
MPEPSPRVIVVEDEAQLRRFVRLALETEGCEVHEADGVKRGLIEAGTRKPDLLILDLGLPDGDGIELIRELRTWSEIPIVVLSARTAETEKVAALDAGADDYLTKPFGAAELLARVRAHLRRRYKSGSTGQSQVSFGRVKVDLGKRLVEKNGVPVHLTPIEFRLLAYVVSNPDCVLTHRQLLKAVWGPSHTEDAHYVRVYMGHLRKKIEDDPTDPDHIVTEPGVGYRFVVEAPARDT